MKYSLSVGLIILLTSCSVVTRIKRDINIYCDSTSTSTLKRVALRAIRIKYPDYPEKGICSILIHEEP